MNDKKIVKNYIYNLLYQILIIILPIVTTPYLSRVLGASNIGIYGYTVSIVTYFTLLSALGIAKYGQREIAYVQDNIEKRSKIFFELNIIRFITTSILITIFYICFCIEGEYSVYFKILILEIIATALDISWFFQGIENFKKVVVRNAAIKIISVILIFVLVKSPEDLSVYLFIYVIANFLGNGIFWLDINKYVKRVKIHFNSVKKHLKPLISLFIPQIAISVYTILDKTMLGTLVENVAEVGYYEQSQKIIKLVLTVITTMSTVMLTKISNVYAQGKKEELSQYMNKSLIFDLFLGFPLMFGIIATSEGMVPWFFGQGYEQIVDLLVIGSPIIIFISISSTIGTQYLVSVKRHNIQTIAVFVGAILNVVLNLLLIPVIESKGALISTVIAELVIAIIEYIYVISKKVIDTKFIIKSSYKYLLASLIMAIVIKFIAQFMAVNCLATIIQVLIGIIIYIVFLYLFKDAFTKKIINIILKRKKED